MRIFIFSRIKRSIFDIFFTSHALRNKNILSNLVAVSLTAALLWSTGCTSIGSASLEINFPDEQARQTTKRLDLYVLKPTFADCSDLLAGSVSPETGASDVVFKASIQYPGGGSLPNIPTGKQTFFLQAFGANTLPLLRGCNVANVSQEGTVNIVINLKWVCIPKQEVCGNNKDDDCDGRVDEDCPSCTSDRQCIDDNPCTIDLCLDGDCHHNNFPKGTFCSDQDPCTVDDKCIDGRCAGTPKDCSAFDGTCKKGICEPSTGECKALPIDDNSKCDDGLWCTIDDVCIKGECTGTPRDCSDDDDLCTKDTCVEGTGDQGHCEHALVPRPGREGPPGSDSCSNGKDDDCDGKIDTEDASCIGCTADGDCDDQNPCTEDKCENFVCKNDIKHDGTKCEDGLFCTIGDKCESGVCKGEPRTCEEVEDNCHDGICVEDQDKCIPKEKPDNTDCEDGLYCTVGDKCQAGECRGRTRACNDNDPCTVDSCDEDSRSCVNDLEPQPGKEGPPGSTSCMNKLDDDCDRRIDLDDPDCIECTSDQDCDDRNPCTTDKCTLGKCTSTNVKNNTECDDGLYCTVDDKCESGKCKGSAKDCSALDDPCHEGICNEDKKTCEAMYKGDGVECNDGLYCTVNEKCDGGSCKGSPRDCEDNDPCTEGSCNEDLKKCVQTVVPNPGAEGPPGHGSCSDQKDNDCDELIDLDDPDCVECVLAADCNDSNTCTDDTCDHGVCRHTPVNDDTPCNDSHFCNGDDYCQAGTCSKHDGSPCSDGFDCTQDLCDEDKDMCSNLVTAGKCLINGTCFNDDEQNPANQCEKCDHSTNPKAWTYRGDDTPCDDSLYCDGNDYCQAGTCSKHDGNPCTDGFDCTDDICDDVNDSCSNPVTAGKCLISGTCFNDDEQNPANQCEKCDHSTNPKAWTWAPKPWKMDICGNGIDEDCDAVPDGCCMGDGTFQNRTTTPIGADPWFIIAGDFNEDGIDDLATANKNSSSVSVLITGGTAGKGDGTFTRTPAGDYGTGGTTYGIITADIDGDGHLDLVTANNSSASSVSIFWGKGDGTFVNRLDIPINGNATFPTTGDFNEDGNMDIAVSAYTDNVAVLLGNGASRSFSTPVYYSISGQASNARSIADGDFNGDDILDLAVAAFGSGNVTILFGNGSDGIGNGTFSNPTAASTFTACSGPTNIITADFNQDAIKDIAVSCMNANKIGILIGKGTDGRGDGTFEDAVLYDFGSFPVSVHAADLNSDNIDDLVVAEWGTGAIGIRLGNSINGHGDGTFGSGNSFAVGSNPAAATVLDATGDQIPDIASADNVPDSISLLEGHGSGATPGFGFVESFTSNLAGKPVCLQAGDLDSDNIPDLAFSQEDVHKAATHKGGGTNGKGDGTFLARWSGDTGDTTLPAWIEITDLDKDSVSDLLIALPGSGSVGIFKGQSSAGYPDGLFDPVSSISSGTGSLPKMAIAADVNEDGIPDILAADETGYLVVLIGGGTGGVPDFTFGSPAAYAAGNGVVSLAAGDLNGDAVLDVALAARDDDAVSIMLGNGSGGLGDGTFYPNPTAAEVPVGKAPVAVQLADLNNDGILDLVTANRDDDTLSIRLGNGSSGRGDGTFTGPATPNPVAGKSPTAVAVFDLDVDGIPDLACADRDDGTVSVFKGLGDGAFAAREVITVGGSPNGLVAGNFDWDHRPDIAVIDSSQDLLLILRGTGTCNP
ncbi:MAG: VCBS repeat-containing protein [Deltaproteobacteria bacterium]|nr:VCBS repeat-containing protein [Deltaproteobacteria bacterium]